MSDRYISRMEMVAAREVGAALDRLRRLAKLEQELIRLNVQKREDHKFLDGCLQVVKQLRYGGSNWIKSFLTNSDYAEAYINYDCGNPTEEEIKQLGRMLEEVKT